MLGFAAANFTPAAEPPPLHLVAQIAVPAVSGTWDHIGADGSTGRLFGNAQDIHTLVVVDLNAGRPIRSVTGPFNRNQGFAFLPDAKAIVVSNGRSGLCVVLNSDTLATEKSIGIGLGADLMAYDPGTQRLYVDHGGRDSNRGFGAVAVIDMAKRELVADIATDLRPAAMAIARDGSRLFVCLPGANQIAVLDCRTRQIATRYAIAGTERPVSIAFDEPDHRLFVLTRTPAQLVVLDSETGAPIAAVPGVAEAEDIWFDAQRRRLYATGLEGAVFVYRQADANHYDLIGKIPTRPHAGTSVWIPEMNRLCVGVPQHENEPAEIWVYEPNS